MITEETTIKDIVTGSPELAFVFERFNLCPAYNEGNIKEVSTRYDIEPGFLIKVLKSFEGSIHVQDEFRDVPIQAIMDFLSKTHDYYLDKKLPEIEQSFYHLFLQYKDTHPLLILLSNFFIAYKKELTKHIQREEEILFPYIQSLIKARCQGFKSDELLEIMKSYSIGTFIAEHNDMESDLANVRKVIVDYSPAYSITPFPYRIFLIQLHLFENDLRKHAQIEDEVLVPKALRLENELLSEAQGRQDLLDNPIIYSLKT